MNGTVGVTVGVTVNRKKRILPAAIAVCFILGAGFAYLVYDGYIHVNGPAAGKYEIKGIDVSHYQGEIDWQSLSGQGIRFAYIKATEGSSHVDERFAVNYAEAGATSLKTGAYHFFSFDSPGLSQAEHFIRTVEAFDGMLRPAVDVEFYGNKEDNPPDPDQVEKELRDFLALVEQAYDRKPVIYATMESWELYIRGRFEEYPLWIRDIWKKPVLPSSEEDSREYQWTFWQYTNRGRLTGFSGVEKFVDLNVFYGNEGDWQEFLDPHSP